jgi:hypothetical protein
MPDVAGNHRGQMPRCVASQAGPKYPGGFSEDNTWRRLHDGLS